MTTTTKLLPDWCCASGCNRCEAWAVYTLTAPDEAEPPSAWCTECSATTYRDREGACSSCEVKS